MCNKQTRIHTTQEGKTIVQRLYALEPGLEMWCPETSCVFCAKLRDLVYDYTNGPYLFFCEDDTDGSLTEQGYIGECPLFVESAEIERHNAKMREIKDAIDALKNDESLHELRERFSELIFNAILYGESRALTELKEGDIK